MSFLSDKNIRNTAIIIASIIFFLWLFSGLSGLFFVQNKEQLGQLGDSFGLINSLFSGLALAGAVYAVLLQSKALNVQSDELKLQKQELIDTRAVLKSQQQEFAEQNKTLSVQRFENTFFQMINLHNQIIDGLETPYKMNSISKVRATKSYKKREVFKMLFDGLDINGFVEKYNGKDKFLSEANSANDMIGDSFYDILSPYYNNLHQMMLLVENAELTENQKRQYFEIIKAQLSTYEIRFLFFFSVSSYADRFLFYINKYSFFEDIEKGAFFPLCDYSTLHDSISWTGS